MAKVKFIDDVDSTTYYPFELIDARETEWEDVRLSFDNWEWLRKTYKTNTINDYYMNGYGVEGLVLAARIAAGLEDCDDSMDPNSEGDTCYIMFEDIETAIETADLACKMIKDRKILEETIIISRENDLEFS